MQNKLALILFLTFTVFPTFYSKAQKTIKFSLNTFEKVRELEGEKVDLKVPLRNPYEIMLLDSFLLVKNINTSPAVDVININTGELTTQFGIRGRGPGELIYPFCIQYIKERNEILLQDSQGRKLVFYDFDLVLDGAAKNFIKEINIKDVLARKVKQVKGQNFFCDLIGSSEGYMNCLLNNKGELIKYNSEYPSIQMKYNTAIGSNLFPTNIDVSADMEKIIITYSYSDQIDIFDQFGEKLVKLIGPNYEKTETLYQNGRVTLTSNNRRAFNIACSDTMLFMVPYCGEKRRYAYGPANHIFCFSMDGELIQRFEITPTVTEITVDWKRKIIYGMNLDEEPTLYKYKF